MVKEDVRLRLQAVKQHLDRGVRATDACRLFGISPRTLKRSGHNYREDGVEGLRYESRRPLHCPNRIHGNFVNRILQRRRRHPAWCALRIHALLRRQGVQLSWRTLHRMLKRHAFMVRGVRKPVPFKRFQRRLVDSLWQVDVYKFRIAWIRGHVYLHTILDDRSRYLVMARAYRREWAKEANNNLWWATKGERSPRRSTSTMGAASSRKSSGSPASTNACGSSTGGRTTLEDGASSSGSTASSPRSSSVGSDSAP